MQLRTSTEELAAKVPLGKRHRFPGERRDPYRVMPDAGKMLVAPPYELQCG